MRLLVFVVVLATLNCSGILLKTFYRNVDALVISELNDNFAFDDENKKFVEQRVQIQHTWHRYQELPRYADFCNSFAERIERGLKPADMEYMEVALRGARARLSYRILPDSITVFQSFDSERIELQRQLFSKSNDELKVELQQPLTNRQQARVQKALSFYSFFLGDLSATQKQLITESVSAMPDFTAQRLKYRIKSQEEFLNILSNGDAEELETYLTSVFTNPEGNYTPAYRSAVLISRQKWKKLILDIDATMNESQRIRAADSLRGIGEVFLELAGRTSSATY